MALIIYGIDKPESCSLCPLNSPMKDGQRICKGRQQDATEGATEPLRGCCQALADDHDYLLERGMIVEEIEELSLLQEWDRDLFRADIYCIKPAAGPGRPRKEE